MYAVVTTGGKQHKVAVNDTVAVEKLDAAVGESVDLSVLLVADGENVVSDASGLSGATVTAEVVGHGKADKVVVFKFKKRKGYKKTRGHRQPLTLLKITDVSLGGAAPKAKRAAKAEAPAAEAAPKPKRASKKAEAAEEAPVATTAPVAEEVAVEETPKPKRTTKKAAKPAEETPAKTDATEGAE